MNDALTNFLLWSGNMALALVISPLLIGIINKTKAFFAGRQGPRLLQLYYDLAKLLKRSSVYSRSTSAVFRIAPCCVLAASCMMLLLLPAACVKSPFNFIGDMILFVYLAGIGRMLTVLAAMETASAFEGMGSSRECQFAILAEGVLLAVLAALVMLTREFSLSGCLVTLKLNAWLSGGTSLLFLAVAFYLVMLCENCRVPVDDPETHLELTMIHEAMILDNSGPDLALIHYAAALKLWVFLSFLASLILPDLGNWMVGEFVIYYALIFLLTISIGVVESVMARYRFRKVPQFLAGALAVALLAIVLAAVFGGNWTK